MSEAIQRTISLTRWVAHIPYSTLVPNLLKDITPYYVDILRSSYEYEFDYLMFDLLACRLTDILPV